MASVYKYLPAELADRLRNLELTVRRPVEGSMQGSHPSSQHGSSVEFADYREYTPGDPPSRIDWAVYGRSDRYVIRRYQEETNLRGYILLDTSESMAFREVGLHSKMNYAAYLAASLMYILVNQGDSVGFMMFNDAIWKSFAPVGTVEGLRPLLRSLEEIQPGGRSQIDQCLHKVAEQVKFRSLIILISDLLQSPAEVLHGVRHLHHNKHQLTVLHVLDGAELSLSFSGLTELRELETGAKLVVQADEIKDAYAHEAQRYLDELRRGCLDCLADYCLIDTRMSLEAALHLRTRRV